MKIGIGLPTQIRDLDAALIPRWSSVADDAGFSTLATVGRFAYPGVMDTVALAGAAAATERITLSSNVMLSTIWPAPLLAKELAGIDAMSGGRLTIGLGIGGDRPDDFVVDGLPPRGLGQRMDSDLETFHRVWRGDPVGGGTNAAVPAVTRRIPMMFGGMAAKSFQRMAKWGNGYIAGALPAPMIEPMFASARKHGLTLNAGALHGLLPWRTSPLAMSKKVGPTFTTTMTRAALSSPLHRLRGSTAAPMQYARPFKLLRRSVQTS